MGQFKFDVFLCHNSQDKTAVIEIAQQLKLTQIKPWLDDWELQPGLPWQPELERQIQNIKSAAVFIGQSGIGPWQQEEIDSFLREFHRRKCPVIPILLPNAPQKPKLPLFLEGRTWVDFRTGSSVHTDPWKKLVWGITGIKPESQPVVQTQQPLELLNSPLAKISATQAVDIIQPLTKPLELLSSHLAKISAGQAVDIIHPLTNIKSPTQIDDLRSEKGIDYSKLRDLLAAQNWEEADKETYEVMIKAVGKKSGDWFTRDELLNFPCQDLRTIDQLWVQYSKGRFGFSVQKEIYLSVGGRLGSYEPETFLRFYETVGWGGSIKYNTLPEGHLPNKVPIRGAVGGRSAMVEGQMPWGLVGISSLASRCVNCNI